jgi:L-2-hydroxyglutarate oxidase LhgO
MPRAFTRNLRVRICIEGTGGTLVLRTPVMATERTAVGLLIRTGATQPARLLARNVGNSAGLDAQSVAAAIDGRS